MFTNNRDTTYKVYWKLYKDSTTWQEGWSTYLCDLNLCYNINFDKCSPNQPNNFSQGTHKFEFHFLPNNIAGCTIIGIRLYGDRNFTQEIYRTHINVNGCISGTKNQDKTAALKIYPNPATENFSLTEASDVKKVVLYNMFGKEVKTFLHYNNAQHEISDLKAGMYVVKMLDEKSKVLKTIKLTKSSGGA
jgi:hypothetical protein